MRDRYKRERERERDSEGVMEQRLIEKRETESDGEGCIWCASITTNSVFLQRGFVSEENHQAGAMGVGPALRRARVTRSTSAPGRMETIRCVYVCVRVCVSDPRPHIEQHGREAIKVSILNVAPILHPEHTGSTALGSD